MLVELGDAVPQIGEHRLADVLGREQVEGLAVHVCPGHQGAPRPVAAGDRIGDDRIGDPYSRSSGGHHGEHFVFGGRFHRRAGRGVLGVVDQEPAGETDQTATSMTAMVAVSPHRPRRHRHDSSPPATVTTAVVAASHAAGGMVTATIPSRPVNSRCQVAG